MPLEPATSTLRNRVLSKFHPPPLSSMVSPGIEGEGPPGGRDPQCRETRRRPAGDVVPAHERDLIARDWRRRQHRQEASRSLRGGVAELAAQTKSKKLV